MSGTQAIRYVIGGRVQGVNYRAATAEEAERLRLDGWVKNLADGRVEVVVTGDQAAIAALAGWLWQGPPGALVDAIHLEEWTGSVPRGFSVAK